MLGKLPELLDRRERWQALGLGAMMLAGALAEAAGIGLVFPLIGLLVHPDPLAASPRLRALFEWSGAASLERFVMAAALALIAVYVLKNAWLALLYFTQTRFVGRLEARIGSDLVAAYLRAPWLSRLQHSTAEQLRVLTSEVPRATAGYVMPLLTLATEAFVMAAITALLLLLEPALTLAALALVAAAAGLFQWGFRRRIEALRETRARASVRLFRWAGQTLGALKEIKVLGREHYFAGGFAASTVENARASSAFAGANLMPRLAIETAAIATLLGLTAAAIAWGQPMPQIVPMLTLFGFAAVRLMPSATRIVAASNNLRFHAPALQAVLQDLGRGKGEAPVSAAPPPARREPLATLELRQAWFQYPRAPAPALQEASLVLRQGEFLGVVGRSGSGKTTLADLLLGLLAPSRGEILVNGRTVPDLAGEWRGVAGLVPQDFYVLDDSIRRNVAFGLPDTEIDEARAWGALELAQLADRVRAMPGQLDAPVGERGAMLSGGERQRLSIARALYEDPEILVLDEATSALDPATEADFITALQGLRGRKTVIMITHRVASTRCCDRILVMEAGRVAAEGIYEALSRGDASYAELMRSAAAP